MNRNLWMLISVQILFMTGNMMFVTLAPIVGKQLAGSANLATLPMAISMLTMLVFSFPLSLYMGKYGRRPVFLAGLTANALAELIFFAAITVQQFSLFLVGSVLFGFSIACANFYRFAAMELVDKNKQSLAISAVMSAGIVAAFIGPNLSAVVKDMFFDLEFSSSVLAYVPISVLALLFVMLIKWPKVEAKVNISKGEIDLKGGLWKPMFSATVAYGVMVLIMSATPLHMSHNHHAYADTAWVIQWHVLGMFAPSLIIGWLVKRVGLMGLLILGALLLISALLVNLIARDLTMLTIGLLLLGIGWNFLFIGASQWLMKLSVDLDVAKIQGINEVMVFGLASIATLSSGWLVNEFGWVTLNLVALPLLVLLLIMLLATYRKELYPRYLKVQSQ